MRTSRFAGAGASSTGRGRASVRTLTRRIRDTVGERDRNGAAAHRRSASSGITDLDGPPSRFRGRRRARAHPYHAARGRLVVVNLLVVAGILALMAIAVYAWEVHATDQQVNDQLYERAARVVVEEGNTAFGVSATPAPAPGTDGREGNDPASEQYEPSSPDVFVVVVSRQGVVTFDPGNVRALGLPDAAALQPVLSGRQASTLVTLGDDQHSYRLYSTPIRQKGKIVGALQVGMSLAARHRQLHDLLVILAAVGGGVLVITSAASFYLAGRALQPMRVAYERQRRFAAAASHELRTPLAIVRSEAELVARGLRRLSAAAAHLPVSATAAGEDAVPSTAKPASSTARVSSIARSSQGLDGEQQRTHEIATRLGDDVQEIVSEVDYMARLVDDLLLLARDEAAPGQFLRRDVDLAAVVAEALAKLVPIAHANGLTLLFAQDSPQTSDALDTYDSLVLQGDRDRLKQLILILVDNAIRYTPSGGSIEIAVQRVHERHLVPLPLSHHGDIAVLTVRDTGIGIAPEDFPHLFEPFYRAKSTRTGGASATGGRDSARKPEGAGLGLAVARWIVLAHGGTITASSEPGQGATFTVSLPLA